MLAAAQIDMPEGNNQLANKRARMRQAQRRHDGLIPIDLIDHSPLGDAPGVARMAAGPKRLRPGSVALNAVGVSGLSVATSNTPGRLINYANDWRSSI